MNQSDAIEICEIYGVPKDTVSIGDFLAFISRKRLPVGKVVKLMQERRESFHPEKTVKLSET